MIIFIHQHKQENKQHKRIKSLTNLNTLSCYTILLLFLVCFIIHPLICIEFRYMLRYQTAIYGVPSFVYRLISVFLYTT